MTICGLACQKEDVVVRGGATDALFSGAVTLDVAVAPDDEGMGAVAVSGAFEAALPRFFSVFSFSLSRSLRSFSFFSRFLSLRAWSSSSVGLGMETPFNRLVSTSR